MAGALGDYPALALGIALAWFWIQDDAREARRHDRKADLDGDAEMHA